MFDHIRKILKVKVARNYSIYVEEFHSQVTENMFSGQNGDSSLRDLVLRRCCCS